MKYVSSYNLNKNYNNCGLIFQKLLFTKNSLLKKIIKHNLNLIYLIMMSVFFSMHFFSTNHISEK